MAAFASSFAKFKDDFVANADVDSLQQQLMALKACFFSPFFFWPQETQLGLAQHGLLQASDAENHAVATSVLEHAALLAVRTKDLAAFERNMAQLQQLYASPGAESPVKYEMLGLNLLRLLAVDKMAEFHTQLEVVPQARRSDKHIQYPVSMEQCMMEGTYHKVIAAAGRAPSPWCAFFAHLLAETVRVQIAESFSSAYISLTPANAVTLLMLSNPADLLQFEKQFSWKRSPSGLLVFGGKSGSEARVPKLQVMEQTLSLAEELERIV